MKSIASILAVAIAIAFTAPAFAGPGSTITNKADCEKAGKVWDDAGAFKTLAATSPCARAATKLILVFRFPARLSRFKSMIAHAEDLRF